MVRAKSTIVGASIAEFAVEGQRNRARLVIAPVRRVCLRVCVNQGFERPAIGAALSHVHSVVAQQHFGIDHLPAFGADAAGEFIKDVVRVLFHKSPNERFWKFHE